MRFRASCYADRMLAPALVDRLVCPRSKQGLVYFPRGEGDDAPAEGFLFAPSSRLRYRIVGGVPMMLPDEATAVTEADAERLLVRAHALNLAIPAK